MSQEAWSQRELELSAKLKALSTLYTLIDDATQMPFLDDDGAFFLYTTEELAREALDYYLQQLRIWHVEPIKQKDIVPFLGREFYSNGATEAIIDGHPYSRLKPEILVAKPDYSAVPETQRPVMNPDYIRALTMLKQEQYWKVDYENKKQVFTAFEDEMIRTFVKAHFLVPFQSNGNRIAFASLDGDDGRTAMPVFSDWDQFALVYDLNEWNGWVMSADDLLHGPADTVVLNLNTLSFAMSKTFMEKMFKIYNEELSGTES